MTLLQEHRKQLHVALCNAFRTENEVRELVVLGLAFPDLQSIARPGTIPDMFLDIIRYFEERDRIEELIEKARLANPTNVGLKTYGTAILDWVQAAAATWYPRPTDPYEACFIEPGPRPFISRDTLRCFLRDMDTPRAFPVLVVNGLSKTGKSYSFQFIGYLKRVLANYQVAWVDLKEEVYGEYKPEDLVHDVAMSLSWDLASLPQRPSTRYAKELSRWMLGQASRGGNVQTVILVLDGFHQPELYGETRGFIQELIRQVAANTSRIRLVLLNYDDALLPPGLPPIQREPLTMLSRPELVKFFTSVALQKGQHPPPRVIDQIVDQVTRDIAPGDPAYNELLNQRVTQAAQLLLQA